MTYKKIYAKIKSGGNEKKHKKSKIPQGDIMKYIKMIEELKNKYSQGINTINKENLFNLYKKIYLNENIKTFENMIGLLKQYEVITDFSKSEYLILEKPLYKMKKTEELIKINEIILKEYKNIKTIVWSTNILNEFTQHYAMNNYIVVETEKFAIELIITLLKEKLMKKYTIVTERMYNENKNMFLNIENMLIVKSLNVKAPLKKDNDGILEPTIEKIMIDLYKDKLYEYYQGKELEHIYINILEKYSINFRKLYTYAKDRVNLEQYKNFIKKLNVLTEI